jgi:hypothetical protein
VSDVYPQPPRNLGEPGRELWESIIPAFELKPDELTILRHACQQEDLIERIREEMYLAEMTTTGSMGQKVISPFISEVRQQLATQANLLKQIKIPESAKTAAQKRAAVSESARKAARTRWGSGAGA